MAPPVATLQVRYINTRLDVIRFNLFHALRALPNQLLLVILAAIAAWPVLSLGLPLLMKIVAIFLIAVVLVAVFSAATIIIAALSYWPTQNRAVLGEHTVEVTQECVREQTSVSSSTWSWRSVPAVKQTRGYIYIYVQQNMAHIIPKRVFASTDDADAFYLAVVTAVSNANAG